MRVTRLVPNLPVADIVAAREFYIDYLGLGTTGLDLGWVARFQAPDVPSATVQLVTRDASAPEDPAISVGVTDLDLAYEEAVNRGYEIVHPITVEPWGVRRFFVRAPDGTVVNVADHSRVHRRDQLGPAPRSSPLVRDLPERELRRVETRLRHDPMAWLTTVRRSGQPDTVPVWFLWDGRQLLIFSRPGTTKLRNLDANPRVAVVLDDTRVGADVVRVEGTATYAAGTPHAYEVPDFGVKYAELIESIGFTGPEAYAETFSVAVTVTPTRIHT